MSDVSGAAPAAAPAATESANVPAVEAPAADPGGGEADVLDGDLPEGMRTFNRSYVERVRAEAAKHRVSAREAQAEIERMRGRYGEFEQYDDNDFAVWKQLATGWNNDARQTAETMRVIANNVLGDPTATPAERQEAKETIQDLDKADAPGPTDPSVDERIEAKLKEHADNQAMQQRVRAIETQLTEAGYPKGSMEYSAVLWYATNDPSVKGDIGAAIQKFQGFRQSVVDDYVQSVKDGKVPPRTASPGQPGQGAPEIHSVKDATTAARAFLDSRRA